MSFIDRFGLIAYIVIIISAIIFNLSGFTIINAIISNVFKVLYFIILVCAITSFYRSKEKNVKAVVFILLPGFLFFTGIHFKVITMIILCSIFLFKNIKPVIRVIGISIYLVFILIGTLGWIIGDFGGNTVIDQKYSPNGVYKVVTIDSDQGGLGGDTYIQLEGMYSGILKKHIKTLYHGHWGEKPKITWVDNNIVNIDGRDINIHVDKTWENK